MADNVFDMFVYTLYYFDKINRNDVEMRNL